MSLSLLDLSILFLVVLGAFLGMKIGTVSAFFDILGGLAGTWAASRFYPRLMTLIPAAPAAYFLLFTAVAGAFVLLGILLSQKWEEYFLDLSDKLFGGLLGVALALILSAVGLIPALMNEASAAREHVRRSAFAPYLLRVSQHYFSIASPDLWVTLDPLLESEEVRRVRRLLKGAE